MSLLFIMPGSFPDFLIKRDEEFGHLPCSFIPLSPPPIITHLRYPSGFLYDFKLCC